MAFKILSQEEIAVLNEHEKKAYEQAYQEYLERTAFVERLEQLDKVRMPQVSVKKKGIKKITPPVNPTMKTQGFAVDSTMGVSLLNATKKIKRTTDNNANLSAQVNYRASLPNVLISVPEKVRSSEITPFVITKSASVPIAEPSTTECEIEKFNTTLPSIHSITMPVFTETIIDEYSVSGIPSVKTESPLVPKVNAFSDFKASLPCVDVAVPTVEDIKIANSSTIGLKPVPVMKPATIDVSIEEYKMPQLVMNSVEAAVVDYTEPETQTVNLSVVPIPDCPSIPTVDKSVAIKTPTVGSISVPDVSVKVDTAEIATLTEVCIPTLAPEVHTDTATIATVNPPACSTPDDIHYSEPPVSVEITHIPLISVPHIDANSALETILSKIR